MKTNGTTTRRIRVLATIICCVCVAAALPGCGGSSAGSESEMSVDADDDSWGEDGSQAGAGGQVGDPGPSGGEEPSGGGQTGPQPDDPREDDVEPDVYASGQSGAEEQDTWGMTEEDQSGQEAHPEVAGEEDLAGDAQASLPQTDDAGDSPDEPDSKGQEAGQEGPDQPIDSDKDGLSDEEEKTIGTDPYKKDSDSDGIDDSAELELGLDPLQKDDPAQFCQDGNACTKDGWSNADKACKHSPVTCNDANPCTDDQCFPSQGCLHIHNTASCEDGNLCTQGDSCKLGACLSGPAVSCDDGDACTIDVCDAKEGCKHKAFSDSPCDDGDPCTAGDHCQAGSCKSGSIYLCGSCKSDFDCADFDDDDLCNGTIACIDGLCAFDKDSVVHCQENGKECMPSQCDSVSGKCLPAKAPDGSTCELLDASVALAQCFGGKCTVVAQKDCDDGNPCTIDLHDSKAGCKHEVQVGTPCKDDIAFSEGETCGEGGFCLTSGPAPKCATDADCLIYDDADKCNGVLSCQDGQCTKGPKVTCKQSSKPCTQSICMPATGKCLDSPVPDDQPCGDGSFCSLNDYCQAGKCVVGVPADCDDGNPCTADFCEPAWGCRHLNGNAACDDGNFCSYNDKCQDGV
ncbi:MAG: hypothetical protein FJ109_12690, partial [Deltaproteobacteria bacterium]|nr:hypothetical protein [Deltaproteobacteria bacterium]